MTAPSSALLQRIRRLQITTHHLAQDMMAGLYHSAFKGRGMDFEEVREYQPGDEVRHIDWNVTARLQHPYTKVFREERELVIWLLVDISPSTFYGSGATLKREYLAEVAALLAFSAVKNNDRVGLLLFSDRVEKVFTPSKGNRHAMRLIREVMALPAKGTGSDLAPALFRLAHLQRRRCTCFVLSDFLYPIVKKPVQLIARYHDLIATMLEDPTEKLWPIESLVCMEDREKGLQSTIDWSDKQTASAQAMPITSYWDEHTALFNSCRAEIIQLQNGQPSFQALRKFFRLRAMYPRSAH
jgi:uncharacterized protein (DUF58 family)